MTDLPVAAVLVDEQSISAAEFFAAALQNTGAARWSARTRPERGGRSRRSAYPTARLSICRSSSIIRRKATAAGVGSRRRFGGPDGGAAGGLLFFDAGKMTRSFKKPVNCLRYKAVRMQRKIGKNLRARLTARPSLPIIRSTVRPLRADYQIEGFANMAKRNQADTGKSGFL